MPKSQVTAAEAAGRPEPFFLAGSVGLDFLNSIATPVDEPVEWLGSGEDLLGWLQRAHLLEANAAATLRKGALPGEIDAVAAQARSLREWFRAFVHTHRGKRLDEAVLNELEPLNQLLSRDQEFTQIVWRPERRSKVPSPLRLTRMRKWSSPETLLLPIAIAMADVVCDEDFAHVKKCEGARCTLIFADHTRTHRRRWCSMSVCGNREKQKTSRSRKSERNA